MTQQSESTIGQFRTLLFHPVILLASLGYFVDMYDLLLFNIVRVESLKSLGFAGEDLMQKGLFLLNCQMAGMLVGGFVFGVLGDKRGRLQTLLASILLYSTATLLNAFAPNLEIYAGLRFLAGIGLAGELGTGVTLAVESVPQKTRGYATVLIAAIGFLGAVAAYFTASLTTWKWAFVVGGLLGFLLLILRIGAVESPLFQSLEKSSTPKGSLLQLFKTPHLVMKLFKCVGVGLPIWFVGGVLIALAPEFSLALGMPAPFPAGKAVLLLYTGTIIGDLAAGLLSQRLRRRKTAIGVFVFACLSGITFYLTQSQPSFEKFQAACFVLGLATGYWALLVTVSAEQFGTNLRATAATSVPNLIRGSVLIISASFLGLRPHFGVLMAAGITGGVCLLISALCLWRLEETYSKDLNFVEP